MISSFLVAHQNTTPNPRHWYCNCLYSEVALLVEQDLLAFRNETEKLLSGIQHEAKEYKKQVTTTQQVTTFQLPEATQATAGYEYVLRILDTQQVSTPAVQEKQMATPQQPTLIAKVQQS